MLATLCGTIREPEIRLQFDRDAVHAGTGVALIEWVRALPGRRFNPDTRAWHVFTLGSRYRGMLSAAGFTFATELDGITNLARVIDPLAILAPGSTSQVQIWPRLIGFESASYALPPGAPWQKGKGHWLVTPADLLTGGQPLRGIEFAEGLLEVAQRALAPRAVYPPAELIPDWFGLDLAPYQVQGALWMTGGTTLLADPPGVGKTRTSLAAAAAVHSRRTLILCPPVVLTHWGREVDASNLAFMASVTAAGGIAPPSGRSGRADAAIVTPPAAQTRTPMADIVLIRAGRKQPPLPECGVVIVPDTLVSARPALKDELVAWSPEVTIVDEAHRAKTWGSARSVVSIELACAATRMSIAMTGTPVMSNPVEVAPLLAMTGHLGPVFGGWGSFSGRYARRDRFGGFAVPRKSMLIELKDKLDDGIWIRRKRSDVLVDQPPTARHAKYVDVDLADSNRAHLEVTDRIDEYLTESLAGAGALPNLDDPPVREQVREWVSNNVALITLLRKAAGMAKVPAAAEMIGEWVLAGDTDTEAAGRTVYDRPLVVWTHHREVGQAMADAVSHLPGGAGMILGGTSKEEVSRLIDDFQAGLLPVLVCSITAAGVGITLTRAADDLFVEADYTPALLQQAMARIDRRGQTRPTTHTTLIAAGTLDEHIQSVLVAKERLLNVVMEGGENEASVTAGTAGNAGDLLMDLVVSRLAVFASRPKRRCVA